MTHGRKAPRFAVVGTGAVGQVVHIPMLAEREDAELAALADVDLPKAKTIAQRMGIADALTPDEVLRRDDLDAVVLCTPSHTHEELAVQALQAGKHVFVERPLALTPEGVERVLAAAKGAGKSVVVGHPQRFRPEISPLHAFVAGGEMGDIYAVRGSWLTRALPSTRPSWRQSRAAGGGALMDLGTPCIDLCLWMVGYPTPKRVMCVTTKGEHEVEDAATVMFETEGGAAFTVEVSNRLFAGQDRYYARFMGSEGSASLPPLEVYKQLGGRPSAVTPRPHRPREDENPYIHGYRRLLDHFVRVVTGSAEATLPEEQVTLMRLIQAAYRSAEEGREVAP